MKYKLFAALSFWILLFSVSCNRDDFSFDSPSQLLRFSKDTVFCDTVYNQVRSETYAVKIFNNEDKDIMIPKISLAGGSASLYRINVDGKSGTQFSNVPLRKKDSLYVFVEIAPVANAPEAIAEDQVVFESPAGRQHVTLFSVVQDAEFFIQSDTNPNILNSSTTWTNEKAKIIFGDLTVAENQTLNIEKGTKVYFFKNSGMKISKNSTLNVHGELGSEVVFRGDRNDARYDTIPKNWNGIVFDTNSTLNMNYGKVFGGTTGIELIKVNEANINNTIIHTFQDFGIYAVGSKVTLQNTVMNNCGQADLGIFRGGNVSITNSTLANYWNLNSSTPALGIYATNDWTNDSGTTETGVLNLKVYNSIVFGEASDAISFDKTITQSSYDFKNSLLKYGTNSAYILDASNIKNEDPKFENYFTQKLNLRVKADSPAKGKGSSAYISGNSVLAKDIVGNSRITPVTIGAYQ